MTTNLCFCCSLLILSLFLHSYLSFNFLTGYFTPIIFDLVKIYIVIKRKNIPVLSKTFKTYLLDILEIYFYENYRLAILIFNAILHFRNTALYRLDINLLGICIILSLHHRPYFRFMIALSSIIIWLSMLMWWWYPYKIVCKYLYK